MQLPATYLKILKAKDQLQLGSQAMIHQLAIFNTLSWSMQGSSFKLSAANYFNVFCHVTLKNHISGVIYSSISSYTSLEREKNTLSKKKYFGHRKPIIFRHKKIKKAYFA